MKTKLPIISSRESLYLETGWEPLAERQKVAKLNTISEIHNNSVPVYLKKRYPSISPTRMFESNIITIHVVGITLSLDVDFNYSRKLLFMTQLTMKQF
jgi:hypothetical protein